MNILGITAPLSWNNAAVIVKNGTLLAAAEEERFSKVKHAPRTPPYKATAFCLYFAKLKPSDIDIIAIGYKSPLVAYLLSTFENIKERDFVRICREAGAFSEYYVGLIRYKDYLRKLGVDFKKTRLAFIPHHIAHAASAYRCSGYKESSILTLDGQGEDDAGLLAFGKDGMINKIEKVPHHQGLGWPYAETTDLLGFTPHTDEGKVMGLSAYGKKRLDYTFFWKIEKDYYKLINKWNNYFWKLYGPRRSKNQHINQYCRDIALTTQSLLERSVIKLVDKLYLQTKNRNLSLAGGVALNCNMNSAIYTNPNIDNIFIQPAADDAGTALGAALEVANQIHEPADFAMQHAYWGSEYTNYEIEKILINAHINYEKRTDIELVAAQELARGKILAWFQGRMEWGPRALGNRSILAHPGLKGMKNKINEKVKHRESWQPFAPAILHEEGHDYFNNYKLNPFMTVTFKAKTKARIDLSQTVHIDNTARIQSVTKDNNIKFHTLLKYFKQITSIGGLLNTSFNDNEQPIVENPKDALRVFFSTGLDILVLGNCLVRKLK